jgi:predicted O-methyltransferase YrrM
MAYKKTTLSYLAIGAAKNIHKPAYLRSLAKATREFRFAQDQSSLKNVGLYDLVKSPLELRIQLSPSTFGETPLPDMIALCTLVRRQNAHHLFEFGTFTGNATLHLAMNAEPDARLHTLDLSPQARKETGGLNWERDVDQNIIGKHFTSSAFSGQITQILGDSLAFDPAPYKNQMDFVWVDACHEAPFVQNDSEKAMAMLKPGGTVAWHDFSLACPDVVSYVSALARTREVFWVEGTQVVFCEER